MKKHIYSLTFILCLIYSMAYTQQSGCDADRYFNTIYQEVTVTSDIKYGENTTIGGTTLDLLMDIYEPTGDQLEKRPLIVFAHGGGFTGGNKEGMDFICEDFAQRGFVTASISYRLVDVPITDPAILQTAVVMAAGDMKAAVRYFREDAATNNTYKIDPDFIFVGGTSAGAITANHVGYLDASDSILPEFMDIIDNQGGFEGNSSTNTQYSSAVQGVLNYSGSLGFNEWIDADGPPLYSFHNEFDDVVGCGLDPVTAFGSCAMHEVAEAVGIKNQFYFYSQSDGHVLWPYTYVRHETAQFLGEILCETPSPPTAWEEAPSGFNNPGFGVWDIEAVNEDIVWLIAPPPRFDVATQNFARTTDGGQTWTTGTIPVSDPAYGSYSISALDENTAWVTTYGFENHAGGEVYKTTDGGLTWTEQSSAFTEPNEAPHGIHFFDENDGFAFAYVEGSTDSHAGYITSDGGENWEKLTPDVYPAQPGERIVDANLDFMEAKGDHLWIGMRNGNVYHSADRGHTWEVNNVSTVQSIASIAFKDEMNGIAVSNFNTFVGIYFNRAYATSDGGVTWSEIPAPPSPATAGIHFVEGSADAPGACGTYVVYYGYTNGGGPGTAYTTDDGQTWTFISEQPVYSIDFASPEVGWVGGITHSPENGLFKWTGDALTGNENCISSSNENIVDNSNLLIYPNPADNILNMELKNEWRKELTLRMVNTLGQEVYSQNIDGRSSREVWEINLSDLSSGMYFLSLSDGSRKMIQPFVKE